HRRRREALPHRDRTESGEGAAEPGDHRGRGVAPVREHAGEQRRRLRDSEGRQAEVGRRTGQAHRPVVHHAPAVTPTHSPTKVNTMRLIITLLALLAFGADALAQEAKRDIPYVEKGHERQVLDVYTPKDAKNLPVVFWIHGGGWQAGDKKEVQLKPKVFTEKGFVFVSTNYRLLPDVDMGTLIRDVAKAVRWTSDHIAEFGGDPKRLFIMGHSAGAQLAAILCTDDRYLKAEQLSLDILN